MNVSMLSAIPIPRASEPTDWAALPEPEAPGSRPASGCRAVEEVAVPEDEEPTDDAGDFNNLLTALLSVTPPPADVVSEPATSSTTSTVATSLAAGSDIPRDGAGSPLLLGTDFTGFTQTVNSSSAGASQTTGATSVSAASFTTTAAATELEQALSALSTAVDAVPDDAAAATALSPASTGSGDAAASGVSTVDLPLVTTSVGETDPAAPAVSQVADATTTSNEATSTLSSADGIRARAAQEAMARETSETVTEPSVEQTPVATSNLETRSDTTAEVLLPAAPPVVPEGPTTGVVETPIVGDDLGASLEPLKATATSSPASSSTSKSSASTRPTAAPIQVDSQSVTTETLVEAPAVAIDVALTPVTGQVGTNERDPLREDKVATRDSSTETDIPTPPLNEQLLAASAANGSSGAQKAPTSFAATLTDSATASTPAHVSQQVAQAIAAYEAELPASGSKEFRMLLDPPELGRLLIQLSRTSKGVSVRIAAENETVRSMLEVTGADLQQTLQLSGFDLGQFGGSSSNTAGDSMAESVFAPPLPSFASGASGSSPKPAIPASSSAVNVVV